MMNIVLNFHKKDQNSAKIFLNLLMQVEEGIDCTYYLQYGDDVQTITIQKTIDLFLQKKKAIFSNELPLISIPVTMTENDPNLLDYHGNHTKRTKQQKNSILQWNLCVYKYIQTLDYFLIVEPDCVVLKNNWVADIYNEFKKTDYPVFGHLKQGKIAGQLMPTHWAGCSVYNSKHLRTLNLEKYFYERYENPWWKYRNEKGTETANNCFWGPAFSGYDVSYDYFLFALYWKEKTGSNNPLDWSVEKEISDRSDLIFCDFHSKRSVQELEKDYFNKLPLIHGIKSDLIRAHFYRHFMQEKISLSKRFARSLPLNDAVSSKTNDAYETLDSLKNKYKGKRCFIIGNGPSLNKTDLKKLKNEYTIGLNRIYLNEDKMEFTPTFYCVVNPNVIEQFGHDIDQVDTVKFIKSSSAAFIQNHWNTFFMDSAPGIGFTKDIDSNKWHEGWTVTYCAMQVAYFLGFKTVVLIGVDHYFENSGKANLLVTATENDKNHFHPNYFGVGTKWQYPDLERSEQSYRIAKDIYGQSGRLIIDATVGGKLEVFRKLEYDRLFNGINPFFFHNKLKYYHVVKSNVISTSRRVKKKLLRIMSISE